ncbi:MAG: FHA domain-containing protein [bacterium]
MALIVEIRDGHGAPVRHRITALPLTIGRALTNDIILDDPYTDAEHARIVLGDDGVLRIDDLGSVNGLRTNGSGVNRAVTVQAGDEVRIGRTTLRFRDLNELVAPALLDDGVPVAGAAVIGTPDPATFRPAATIGQNAAALDRVLSSTQGRVGVCVAYVAALAINSWLGNTDRSVGTSVFGEVLGLIALTMLWAVVWSVVGRAVVRRFDLLGHVAMISLAMLVLLGWSVANDWLIFLFPDATIVQLAYSAVILSVLTALIVGHLSLATTLSRRRQWRAAFAVSGTVTALIMFAALVSDDKFSDVSKFANQLEPMAAGWVPARSPSEFGAAMRELKDEVDKAAEKDSSP